MLKKNSYSDYRRTNTYHRYFGSLRGVDFSSDPAEVSRSHFAYLENMWCDPMTLDGVATETVPGYRIFARLGAPIHGIFRHRTEKEDHLVVHAGTSLYRFPESLRNFKETLALTPPLPVSVSSTAGCAFAYGESLYLLIDGEYIFIDKEGGVSTLSENPLFAYIPTTYYNGEPHEQRNLLSPLTRLAFTADGDYEAAVGEEDLLFSVFNREEKTCAVRISERARGAGKVSIPATVALGKEIYTVVAISPRGFADMPSLVSIDIPDTVTVIGASAFFGDSALRYINIPKDTTSIGHRAFFGCLTLAGICMGDKILIIGESAFDYCESLTEVRFLGTEEAYQAIKMEGENTLHERDLTLHFESDSPYESYGIMCRYPIHEAALAIQSVYLDDIPLEYNYTNIGGVFCRYQGVSDGNYFTHIEITAMDAALLVGKTLSVTVSVSPIRFSHPNAEAHLGTTGKAAFLASTAVIQYDGRLFFTGSKEFPNTVFYTSLDNTGRNNPLYIGCLNYFNDGIGSVPNRGFAIAGGLLAVCKSDTGGEGEIFLHAPKDTGEDLIPRIYPLTASIPGTGVCDGAVSFAGETLLFGKRGALSLVRCDTEGEKALSRRSTAIDLHFTREDTAKTKAAVFEGLLYLLCEGSIYLADPRRRTSYQGGTYEYEWYYLSGIGSYTGDRPVYRYTSYLPTGAELYGVTLSDRVGEVAEGEIFSAKLADGEMLYYANTDNGRFCVDSDGERIGGVFSPATHLLATDTALYFGTATGDLGCFNTDKRGQALFRSTPSPLYALVNEVYLPLTGKYSELFSKDMTREVTVYQKAGEVYTACGTEQIYADGENATLLTPLEEYENRERIHRYYYSHAGHAYRSACMLAADDGDIPHFAKDTLSHSAVIKLKCPEGSGVTVSVRTDRHPFRVVDKLRLGNADAGDSDFTAFDFHSDAFASLSVREKERGWCYKQYLFESTDFRAPFGIYSLTYSYRPAGRIKP